MTALAAGRLSDVTHTAAGTCGGSVILMGRGADEALARAAVDGDSAAFAELYDRHERRAFNLAYRITGTREDAADATQEAFLKVLARLPRMSGRRLDFGNYLLTAVRHASYDVLASSGRTDPTADVPESARPVGCAAAPPPEEDPGRRVLLAAQQEEIRAANASLPPRQRAVLALRELEGFSYDEIAEQMGMNRNSVAQLISRARIGLRDALRRTALLSIVPATAACEQALALVAMRDDGEKVPATWLDGHLEACETCALAREAMAEAGASYRAWAPITALEVLRRDTIALAGDRLGHDWGRISTPTVRWTPRATRPRRRARAARVRRDAFTASAVGVLILLALMAAHAQDGVVEPGVEAAPAAPVADTPASPRASRDVAAKPRAAAATAAGAVAPAPAPRRVSAPAAAAAAPGTRAPATDAPSGSQRRRAAVVERDPVAKPAQPAIAPAPRPVVEDVADEPAVVPTEPTPPPPPPPPPASVVTNLVAQPPPPPPPSSAPKRRPGGSSGGSSGVPAP
jgi:RNA polymerase sigma factor (sigma-70 family)